MVLRFKAITPNDESRNTVINGTIITLEICSATRGSLTREETKIANMAEMTERTGPKSRIPASQVGLSTYV